MRPAHLTERSDGYPPRQGGGGGGGHYGRRGQGHGSGHAQGHGQGRGRGYGHGQGQGGNYGNQGQGHGQGGYGNQGQGQGGYGNQGGYGHQGGGGGQRRQGGRYQNHGGQGRYQGNQQRRYHQGQGNIPRSAADLAAPPLPGADMPGEQELLAPATPPLTQLTTFTGVLELHPKGYGFLRQLKRYMMAQVGDPYVGNHLVERFHLPPGVLIEGTLEPGPPGSMGPRLRSIEKIEGQPAAPIQHRDFETLTPIDPEQWIRLETNVEPISTRVLDMLAPIGKGQRGLIVAPPRSGKTILLQQIATAVATNYPEMHIMVILVDERPEEVTDMSRTVRGEVCASSSDRETIQHIRMAETALNRAKFLATQGKDVFVLLDSLTRLARAYNKESNSGRTMTGGVDIKALEIPKRLFGSARAFEEGGSLTIMGTALIETGSKQDDVIFQEFKGTGNMEVVLDRKLAERRIYPAFDIGASGTRKEERILPAEMYKQVTMVRRSLAGMKSVDGMMMLIDKLQKSKTNAEFLDKMGKSMR
ncbi:MAG: transcription termination factor Rho [Gemmatales bacterium]